MYVYVCVCGSHVLHAQSHLLTIHTFNGTIVVAAANARMPGTAHREVTSVLGTAGFLISTAKQRIAVYPFLWHGPPMASEMPAFSLISI